VKGKPAICLKEVWFRYRGFETPALRGVEYGQEAGEFAVLAGRSGAGKSTLCKAIMGIVPTLQRGEMRGEVYVLGRGIAGFRPFSVSRWVGLVFQDFEAQLFSTSVELEVAFGPENLGLPREEVGRRVRESLEAVGLEGFERREPWTLSGGEKQRLAIASVLAMGPPVLVLDEPTTVIDPLGRDDVHMAVRELRERGHTVLLVEHDVGEVEDADSLALMSEGKIVWKGKMGEAAPELLTSCGVRPPEAWALASSLGIPPAEPDKMASDIERLLGSKVERVRKRWEARRDTDNEVHGEVLLEMEDVRYSYPSSGGEALRGISFEVRRGEFSAVLGPNGSGKSTLAKLMAGLLKPSSGRVRFRGGPVRPGEVGYVFQNPDQQLFAPTVWDEVAFGPKSQGLSEEALEEAVGEALEAVGLSTYGGRDPFSLTRGERQRIAVASVLACSPEVLILDEPTTGLDYEEQKRMMAFLEKWNLRGGTVVLITHSMWVAARYARRCIVLREGEVVADGPTREVFRRKELLRSAHLKPPFVTQLGDRLGMPFLSVEEALRAFKGDVYAPIPG